MKSEFKKGNFFEYHKKNEIVKLPRENLCIEKVDVKEIRAVVELVTMGNRGVYFSELQIVFTKNNKELKKVIFAVNTPAVVIKAVKKIAANININTKVYDER